jgi:hypothetical protein
MFAGVLDEVPVVAEATLVAVLEIVEDHPARGVLARRLLEQIDQLLRREATRQRLDRRAEKSEGGKPVPEKVPTTPATATARRERSGRSQPLRTAVRACARLCVGHPAINSPRSFSLVPPV